MKLRASVRAVVLTMLVASVTCTTILYATVVWAAEPDGQVPVSVPWGTGLGGAGAGALGMYFWLHSRIKVLEAENAAMGPKFSELCNDLRNSIEDFKAHTKTVAAERLAFQEEQRSLRKSVGAHEKRLDRLEREHNLAVRIIKRKEPGAPIEVIEGDVTPVHSAGSTAMGRIR